MSYLMINNTDVSDLVQGMKTGYETLVSSQSGRNANGDTVLDIVNKKRKIYIKFRPMDQADMTKLLTAIQDYVVTVKYRDSKTGTVQEAKCYTGTPEPEYYWILNDNVLYKAFDLNFIEL